MDAACNGINRHPNEHGFAMYDRVLIINHMDEDFTGMVIHPGSRGDRNLTILFDHLKKGHCNRELVVPMDNCVLIPYPFYEGDMKIKYKGLRYIQFSMEGGYAQMTVVE